MTALAPRPSTDNLYAISANLAAILARLDDEIPPDLADELDALETAFALKAHACCCVLRSAEARAVGIQTEIDRLTQMRDREIHKAEFLRQYVLDAMRRSGQLKLKMPLFDLTVCRNGRPAVRLKEGAPIPVTFQKLIERVEFDRERAYRAWQAGEDLGPDVEVVQGCHLRIK